MSQPRTRFPDDARRSWSPDQVRTFVKLLRRDVGDAWGWFDLRVREALVSQCAFGVVRSQHADAVKVDAMDCLIADMLLHAGLRTLEEDGR